MSRRLASLATAVGIAVAVVGCADPAPPPAPTDVDPRAALEASAEDTYVGTAECVGCHPDVAATFAQTGMGRAFYPMTPETAVEDFARDNEIEIPGTGLRYRMIERDGRYYQRQFVPDSRGGELVADVGAALPRDRYDALLGEMMLEP